MFFALASSHLGLVAADTRLNLLHADGTRQVVDEGPVDFFFSNGLRYAPPADSRKIRRLDGGWAVGAGAAVLLEACLSGASDTSRAGAPGDDLSPLLEVIARVHPLISDALPEPGSDRLHVAAVLDRASVFRLMQLAASGGSVFFPGGADYVLNMPSELPPDVGTTISTDLVRAFGQLGTVHGIEDVLGVVGSAFATVHAHSHSVGPIVQLGVSLRLRQGVMHFAVEVDSSSLARDPEAAWAGRVSSGI